MKPLSIVTNEDNMQMMARYPDGFFDLAIVDPPYGINADKHQLIETGGKAKAKKTQYHIGNWDSSAPEKQYFNELKRVSNLKLIYGINFDSNERVKSVNKHGRTISYVVHKLPDDEVEKAISVYKSIVE